MGSTRRAFTEEYKEAYSDVSAVMDILAGFARRA